MPPLLLSDDDLLLADPAEAASVAAGDQRVTVARAARRERQRNRRQALDDDVALDRWFFDPMAKHVDGADLKSRLIGEPEIVRSITGASHISAWFSDKDMTLLRSELLSSDDGERLRNRVDVNVDGLWFRLDGCNGVVGENLELVSIARPVADLRDLSKPRKARRDDENYRGQTRAEFGLTLVRSVKGYPIGFYAPQLHKRQAEQASDTPAESSSRKSADGSKEQTALDRINKRYPAHYTGQFGGKASISEYEVRLVCELAGFTPTEAKQMWQVARGESGGGPDPNRVYPGIINSSSGATGLFQHIYSAQGALGKKWIDDLGGTNEMRNPVKSAIVARKLFVESKRMRGDAFWPWEGLGFLNRNEPRAKSVLGSNPDLSDVSSTGTVEVTTEKPYEFTVGPPNGGKGENYWEALQRMADEVRWRCFESGGVVYFVSEKDLFRAKPKATIRPDTEGVERVEIVDWLRGRRVQEVQIQARVGRWAAPPGTVIALEDFGPLSGGEGKWLVTEIRRPIFSTLATITLRKPQKAKREPPNEVETTSLPGPGQDPSQAGGGGDGQDAGRIGPKSDFAGNHFAWPTDVHTVVGAYGTNRGDHIHAGIDIGSTNGSVCRAAEAGTCTNSFQAGGAGLYVTIDHGNGWSTRYFHLSKSIVGDGEKVAKGQKIGYTGGVRGAPTSGNSQGPHLHFEVISRDRGTINPLSVLP